MYPRELEELIIGTVSEKEACPEHGDKHDWYNRDWNDYIPVISETQPALKALSIDITEPYYYRKRPLGCLLLGKSKAVEVLTCTIQVLLTWDFKQCLLHISDILPPSLPELRLLDFGGWDERLIEILCTRLEDKSAAATSFQNLVLAEKALKEDAEERPALSRG